MKESMNRRIGFTVIFTLMVSTSSSLAIAKDRPKPPSQRVEGLRVEGLGKVDRDISRTVLSTERGRKLVSELQMLRNSELTMGKKHPLLPEVKLQIKSVKRKLASMAADKQRKARAEVETLARKLDQMSDKELRILVSQLIGDVRFLRERLIKLERATE